MDRLDKITLGTLVSTAVVGLGGGAFAGFCYAHDIEPSILTLDTRNCALVLSLVLGVPTGGMIGIAEKKRDRDKGIIQSHGEILDGIEDIVSGFSGGIFYGILGGVSTGIGYGLGYLAGNIFK